MPLDCDAIQTSEGIGLHRIVCGDIRKSDRAD